LRSISATRKVLYRSRLRTTSRPSRKTFHRPRDRDGCQPTEGNRRCGPWRHLRNVSRIRQTKRVINTPEQKRSVSFARTPALVFAASSTAMERNEGNYSAAKRKRTVFLQFDRVNIHPLVEMRRKTSTVILPTERSSLSGRPYHVKVINLESNSARRPFAITTIP